MTEVGTASSTKNTNGTAIFGNGRNAGSISLKDKNNKTVSIQSHDTISSSYKIIIPQSIGTADEVLKISSVSGTNAVCEWGTGGGGGGGGSGIVNNRIDGDLTIGEDDSEILTIASKININGNEKTLPNKPFTSDKGKIVTVNAAGDDLQYGPQVLKHNMNFKNIYDTGEIDVNASTTGNNNPAVHDKMNITITPQLTTSKVMVTVNMIGEWSVNPNNMVAYLRRTINSVVTDIFPTDAGNRNAGLGQFVISYHNEQLSTPEVCNFHYVDEPNTTLEVRYDVMLVSSGNVKFRYNRSYRDNNSGGEERGASFISAEEKFANDDGAVGALTSFTQEQALAGAGGTAAFTAYSLYGNNATDVITGTNGDSGSHGHYWNTYTEAEHISNNDITSDVAIRLESTTTSVGISYEFTTPQIITKYRIWMHSNSSAALAKTPKQWEFRAATDKSTYVSTDSSKYTVLDSQSNVTTYPYITGNNGNTASNNPNLANEYNLSTIGAYKYYVLHVTSIQSSDVFSISELALYGGGFTIPSQVGNSGKQLITNGTSLSWGSPSSILVPSPTGNANKVLQANSGGTALEYGDSEIFKRWVSIMGSLDVTAGRNYKFPWDNSTIESSNNNFIVFNESYDDFVISKTGFYRWFLKTRSGGSNSHGSRNYNWTLRLPGSSRTTSNPTSSVHTVIYSGVDEWRAGGTFTYTPSPSGNQDTTFSYFVGTFEIDSSLTNQNIALQNGYSNRWFSTTYFTDSEFFIEKIS